ncbi:DNA/RNA non-specific endonuclease [Lysobacter panacisoli]|nr:DNA/RNA non-specific endonuclease [Lysobacter panacisoli]
MRDRNATADRKRSVMLKAGERFAGKGEERARTAARLAAGGPLAAASPALRDKYLARESTKAMRAIIRTPGSPGPFLERRIGPALDWDLTAPTTEARRAGRPVARIVGLDNGRIVDGYATGFVIAPGLLMTNWHVFDSPEDTDSSGAQFDFELDEVGNSRATAVFEFDPARFFYSNEALDIAIVALADRPHIGAGALRDFGAVPLIPTLGKILVGQAVNIIQHPDGRMKHYALQKNTVYVEPTPDDLFLMYTTDTLEGSSGSPAFNKDWELVAVHHGGVPRVENNRIMTLRRTEWRKGMPETDIDWVANEGARVSKILAHLHDASLGNAAHQAILAQVLGAAHEVVNESEGPATVPVPSLAVTSPIDTPPSGELAMNNITVHGTAHFYMGGAPTAPATPSVAVTRSAIAVAPAALEKKLRFDPNYRERKGYNERFLTGFRVPAPDAPDDEIYVGPRNLKYLKYHHYTVAMHKDRRLALWTASNVDYDPEKRRGSRDEFGEDEWKADPRIPIEQQIEDLEFYEPAKKFDRGHLVRRDDSAWGETPEEEEFANADTFHWTNCSPQHEEFNRDMFQYHGLWGGLENHIAKQAQYVDNKLIVFAGPVLATNDPSHDFGSGIKVQMPMAFWKIVVVVEGEGDASRLRAYGFILDQSDMIEEHGLERRFRAGKFVAHQVPLSEITERSRVEFVEALHKADPLAGTTDEGRRVLINMDQLVLR